MVFRIKKTSNKFSCSHEIEWNHNHAIQAGHSYSFEDIPPAVIERIKTMYEHNYTPGVAYKEFVKGVKCSSKNQIEFYESLSHRSKIPRRREQLYTQFKIETYCSKNVKTMFDLIKSKIQRLIKDKSYFSIQFNEFDSEENSPFVLTFITPLMKRVHTVVSYCLFYIRKFS